MLEITRERRTILRVELLAPQVEEAIAQPCLFGEVRVARDLKGEWLGARQHGQLAHGKLDRARGEAGVDGVRRTGHDLARHLDHRLRPQRVCLGKYRAGGVDHALRQPVVVAQIDEDEVAVVALAVNPPRDAGGLAHVTRPQLPAGMRPIRMHGAQVYLGSVRAPPNRKSSSARVSRGTWRCAPELISRTTASPRASSLSPAITAHAAPSRLARSSSLGSFRMP